MASNTGRSLADLISSVSSENEELNSARASLKLTAMLNKIDSANKRLDEYETGILEEAKTLDEMEIKQREELSRFSLIADEANDGNLSPGARSAVSTVMVNLSDRVDNLASRKTAILKAGETLEATRQKYYKEREKISKYKSGYTSIYVDELVNQAKNNGGFSNVESFLATANELNKFVESAMSGKDENLKKLVSDPYAYKGLQDAYLERSKGLMDIAKTVMTTEADKYSAMMRLKVSENDQAAISTDEQKAMLREIYLSWKSIPNSDQIAIVRSGAKTFQYGDRVLPVPDEEFLKIAGISAEQEMLEGYKTAAEVLKQGYDAMGRPGEDYDLYKKQYDEIVDMTNRVYGGGSDVSKTKETILQQDLNARIQGPPYTHQFGDPRTQQNQEDPLADEDFLGGLSGVEW